MMEYYLFMIFGSIACLDHRLQSTFHLYQLIYYCINNPLSDFFFVNYNNIHSIRRKLKFSTQNEIKQSANSEVSYKINTRVLLDII